MKKVSLLASSLLILLGLAGSVGMAVAAKSGINYVKVSSCEQAGKDIKISRNSGNKYTLTSSVRNAGHGLRDYKLSCVSGTKYKVEWTEVEASAPADVPSDTQVPEIIFSGKRVGAKLDMDVYVVDKNLTSPITKIEVYQHPSNTLMFVWEDSGATAKDVLRHFQNNDFSKIGTNSFVAKAYDTAGNVGTSVILVLPQDTSEWRVANSSLTWIYDNVLLKTPKVKENGLKGFYVQVSDSIMGGKEMVAICKPLLSDVNNFPCVYFKPINLRANGVAHISFWGAKDLSPSSLLPMMPYSW